MDNKSHKRNNLLIMVLGFIIGFAIGITFSFFSHLSTTEPQEITTGNIEVVYENENTFKLNGLIPIMDSDILEEATKISFTIRNVGQKKAYVWINIIDILMSNNLKNENFKWAVYENDVFKNQDDFLNVDNNSINIVKNIELGSNEYKNYSVYIWISENKSDQSSMMKNQFKGKIEVVGYDKYR